MSTTDQNPLLRAAELLDETAKALHDGHTISGRWPMTTEGDQEAFNAHNEHRALARMLRNLAEVPVERDCAAERQDIFERVLITLAPVIYTAQQEFTDDACYKDARKVANYIANTIMKQRGDLEREP